MAKALPINREEIKAFYIASGGSAKDTAERFNLKPGLIRQWVMRYQWPSVTNTEKKISEARQELKSLEKGSGIDVTHETASQALEEHLATSTKVFKTGMATALQRIGETAGSMDGLTALENARKLKDSADIAKTILGIGQDSSSASLQVNLLTLSLDNIIKPVQAIEI
jgi:transposase-like protein